MAKRASFVGGNNALGEERLRSISLTAIDLLLRDASRGAAFHQFCALSFLTTLINNDVSAKVNARALRESFGQNWRDAGVFRVPIDGEKRRVWGPR